MSASQLGSCPPLDAPFNGQSVRRAPWIADLRLFHRQHVLDAPIGHEPDEGDEDVESHRRQARPGGVGIDRGLLTEADDPVVSVAALAAVPHFRGHRMGFERGHRDGGARFAERLKEMDANKDGVITLEEFLGRTDGRFARLDKNGDGFIDASDLAAAAKENTEYRIKRFLKMFDTNVPQLKAAIAELPDEQGPVALGNLGENRIEEPCPVGSDNWFGAGGEIRQ